MGGSNILIAVAFVAIAAGVCWFVMLKARERRYNKLNQLVQQGDREMFFKELESPSAKAVLSLYAREYLRLQMLAKIGSDKDVRQQTNILLQMQLKLSQRQQVLTACFEILARRGDVKHCKRVLKEIEASLPEASSAPYRLYFDTALERKGIHQAELEEKLAGFKNSRAHRTRGYLEYLLSIAYRANGNTARARELMSFAAADYGVQEDELERSVDIALYV